ncbi:magnesium transporter [Prosthecobacter debontii]|uniref:Magnesium transporter n=1 Tax=Prosthecobacter debontii TaxID=48467 RepID=A0A1T4YW31_9BACT|nr:magnesium transporter [Prosthecobacter debontii]SKB05982.1 magnesium transporter [Prosthecobacter debontii]
MSREDDANLLEDVRERAPYEAADLLETLPAADGVRVLEALNPMVAQQVLHEMTAEHRCVVIAAAPIEKAHQWMRNQEYPEDSVGWLMEPPVAVFRPSMTIRDTIEALRKLTKRAFITYGYVTDDANRLLGVLVFRDLMLGKPEALLSEVMYKAIFALKPDMELTEAMKLTVNRHLPVYPVCDEEGRLLGLVRGQNLFEARAIEISAQAGTMVGVNDEERLSTPVLHSLRFRHPWLQINLVTAFLAAAVVGFFEHTLDRLVLLAAFLPVLAGQSGNTGCQALAVALRGMTLGDLKEGDERRLVMKEGALGLLNGALVGVSAGVGMFIYARMQGNAQAWLLGLVVWLSMVASCIVSGLCGALIPLALRKLGADPATASSIFLTTATDVVSMGVFLSLATVLV